MAATDLTKALFALPPGQKPFAPPFYWAGFQCVGAGWAVTA